MLPRKTALWEERFLALSGELSDLLAAAVPNRHVFEPVVELVAEAREEGRDRGAKRAVAAVLALHGNAESAWAGRAEETFRADFRGPAGQGTHQLGVGLPEAADELWVRPHRGGDAAASPAGFEPREHERDPLEREREADDAAAVDCRLQLAGLELGGGCDLGQDLVLERVGAEAVTPRLAAARPARGEAA